MSTPASSSPNSWPAAPAKDAERLAAEALALDLGKRAGANQAALGAEVAAMTDAELRACLWRLKHQAPAVAAVSAEAASAAALLLARAGRPFGTSEELRAGLDWLRSELQVEVAADGLIEPERLTPQVAALLDDATPIALHHHTASSLLPAIASEGLKVGLQTNFFNTQAGVYLSTMTGASGQPVAIYGKRAARVHGGEPVVLRVRRLFGQLVPDPDDADLDWAQGRQYVSPPVPPEDITNLPSAPGESPVGDDDVARPRSR